MYLQLLHNVEDKGAQEGMIEKRVLPILFAVIVLLLALQSLVFAAGSENAAFTPPPGSAEETRLGPGLDLGHMTASAPMTERPGARKG